MGNDKKKTPVYLNSGQTYNRDKDQNNGKKYADNKNIQNNIKIFPYSLYS